MASSVRRYSGWVTVDADQEVQPLCQQVHPSWLVQTRESNSRKEKQRFPNVRLSRIVVPEDLQDTRTNLSKSISSASKNEQPQHVPTDSELGDRGGGTMR